MSRPAQPSLVGTWIVELTLDSAGIGPLPTVRTVRGRLAFGTASADSVFGWHSAPSSTSHFGRSRIDFTPFFGGPVASDVSTTVVGPVDTGFVTEAFGGIDGRALLLIDLIPRISHGGVSMRGQVHGDSATGTWEQRAYCCGARGRFRMWRTGHTHPAVALPPRPAPPPPLDTSRLGKVRVRVWDEGAGRWVRMGHALRLPGGGSKSVYHTGDGPEGWGTAFWLEPGEYAVELTEFPCGADEWSFEEPVRRAFAVRVGAHTEVSITVNLREADAAKSYNNPAGLRCSQ